MRNLFIKLLRRIISLLWSIVIIIEEGKKLKCLKCTWTGTIKKCKKEDYSHDRGPLAYASGTNILCPKCSGVIKEINGIRS